MKYSPLASYYEKQTDIAKTQIQELDTVYEFDRKEDWKEYDLDNSNMPEPP